MTIDYTVLKTHPIERVVGCYDKPSKPKSEREELLEALAYIEKRQRRQWMERGA